MLLALVAAAGLGYGAWVGLAPAPAPGPQAAGPPPVPVRTEPAGLGPLPVEIAVNGTVTPEAVATVRTRVDGQIEQVHVREGQMVRRGDPLFTLDTTFTRAVLAQQEAQLARDRALLGRFQADQARYTSLRGDGFAAQQRLEQAQSDAAAAAATVRAGEALLAQTRTTLGFAQIEAEVDGRLGALPLRAGNVVRASEATALATITRMDPMLVQFAVPERHLPEIRAAAAEGQPPPRVTARAPDDARPPAEGGLVFVDSQVDAASGTILLKARFPNPDQRLWPGQYVQVTLVPRVEPRALTVPVAAVQAGQEGRFVYVLEEGRARRRPVALRRVAQGRAVLEEGGVAPGAAVVTDGAGLLADGARAVERPPAAAPPSATAGPRTAAAAP